MAVNFSMEIQGEQQISRQLSRFGENLQDLTPAWHDILKQLKASSTEQFQSEGHGKWAPLSPAYAKWKRKHYPGKPLMVRSGALEASLTGQTGDTLLEIRPLTMKWGTSLGYAQAHQRGAGHLPQRKVVDLTPDDKKAIIKIVQAFVVKASRMSEQ